MTQKLSYEELEQMVKALEKEVAQLKLIEEQLNIVIDHSPIPTAMGGSDGSIIAFNEALENLVGYKRSEIKNVTVWAKKLYPDEKYRDFVWKNISQALEGNEQDCTEFIITCNNGSTKVVDFKTSFFQSGLIIQMIDITDRKRAEEALRESEEKYKSIISESPIGISIYDTSGQCVDANDSIARIVGTTKEQVLHQNYNNIESWKESGLVKMAKSAIDDQSTKRHYLNIETTFGKDVKLDCHLVPFSSGGLLLMAADITEQKRVEETLRESEERFRNVYETAPLAFVVWDKNANVTDWNKKAEDIFGWSKEEVVGYNFFDFLIPEKDRPQVEDVVKNLLKGDLLSHSINENLTKEGKIITCEWNNSALHDNDGKIVGAISLGLDITDRKQSEEELKKLASVVKYSNELINLATLDGEMVFLNESGSNMLGIDPDEVERVHIMEVIPDHMQELVQNELLPALMQGNKWEGELQYRHIKTGDLIDVYARTFTIHEHNKKEPLFLANVSMDITGSKIAEKERKKLEAQLHQAQKMESIGTLAGGIAHDFNNILSPIILHSEMALEDISEKSPLRFSLEEIHKASLRAKDLVKQILTFSRQDEQERIPLIIYPVIKEALILLRASLPSTIEIRQNIEAEDSVIFAAPTQMHQILMNLCTNAANAMREKGGILMVSLVNVNLHSDDTDHIIDLEPGQYIKLTVSDNGHGIKPAIMEKIFDPYFTTQENGKGTGLGLSIVHGIVNNHGGHILAFSELGKGTRFDVYLPLLDSTDMKSEMVPTEKLATGNEHVLLVDDEEQIVDILNQILERLGYQVTARTSSIDALEMFRTAPDKFDFVITDMTMPNMTGIKLSQKLLEIRPDIPIIICTGFSEQISEVKAKEIGIRGYIMKPVVKSELAKKVREILDNE